MNSVVQHRFRRPAIQRLLLPLLLSIPLSQLSRAQGPALDGTYHFGQLGGNYEQACLQTELVTIAELGVLQFLPDGTFTSSGTVHKSCSGGLSTAAPFAGGGAYTLSKEGQLHLDFAPMTPGVETADAQVSWDRSLIVAAEEDRPAVIVAVRAEQGLDAGLMHGAYALAGASQVRLDTEVVSEIEFGELIFDGVGGYVGTRDWIEMLSGSLTSHTGEAQAGGYTIAPDGSFSFTAGSVQGAVSGDGRVGFLIERLGSRTGLRLLVEKSTVAQTPHALDDFWRLAEYGADRGNPSLEVQPNNSGGQLVFDADSGRILWSTHRASVGSTGIESEVVTGSSLFEKDPAGSFAIKPGEPDFISGHLASSEDVAIFSNLRDSFSPSFGILLREWGPLAANKRALSAGAGGAQALSIRAGANHAGRPYLVLGSMAGSYPGFSAGSVHVPLNIDSYTLFTLNNPNTSPLFDSLGFLDDEGRATAVFAIPPSSPPSFIGTLVCHACLVVDLSGPGTVVLGSNAVGVEIDP